MCLNSVGGGEASPWPRSRGVRLFEVSFSLGSVGTCSHKSDQDFE